MSKVDRDLKFLGKTFRAFEYRINRAKTVREIQTLRMQIEEFKEEVDRKVSSFELELAGLCFVTFVTALGTFFARVDPLVWVIPVLLAVITLYRFKEYVRFVHGLRDAFALRLESPTEDDSTIIDMSGHLGPHSTKPGV